MAEQRSNPGAPSRERGGSLETSEPPTTGASRQADPLDRPSTHVRLFGTHEFFRFWLAQVVSSTGDWLGFSALILLAAKVGGSAGAGAVSLVVAARLVPGFFFAPLAGVLVDRWDRKRTMVVCDLGRAAVVAMLPFVDSLAALVAASLVLEVFTLLWSPAKDATTPNLVPPEHLTTANSLSLGAAYGTFPLATLLFTLMAGLSTWLAGVGALSFLDLDQVTLALYVDVLTFLFGAIVIGRLALPRRTRAERAPSAGATFTSTLSELKEGWRIIALNPTVRTVNVGIATGLIGGGMLIPLGAVFSTEVLDAGAAGYGAFITALGFGAAAGAVAVSALQGRIPKMRAFIGSLLVAGVALLLAASASTIAVAVAFVFLMGMAVGPVYVLGFALLQAEVDDSLRGRVFGALNTLVRVCVLVSMVLGPLVAAALGGISASLVDSELDAGLVEVAIPGVRLALWLGGLVIIGAGLLALSSLRRGQSRAHRVDGGPPAFDAPGCEP